MKRIRIHPLIATTWLLLQIILSTSVSAQDTGTINTPLGSFHFLLSESAPKTCEAFKKYVADGVYENSFIHHADDRILMGGKPSPNSKPKYSDSGNFSYKKGPPQEEGLPQKIGVLIMGRTVGSCNPNMTSNSTQFAIALIDQSESNEAFTAFAKITGGLENLATIQGALQSGKDPIPMTIVLD